MFVTSSKADVAPRRDERPVQGSAERRLDGCKGRAAAEPVSHWLARALEALASRCRQTSVPSDNASASSRSTPK